jgi:hypothetical protein
MRFGVQGGLIGKNTRKHGEEFSCSEQLRQKTKLDSLRRFDTAALRKHHSRDPSEAASHPCHSQ